MLVSRAGGCTLRVRRNWICGTELGLRHRFGNRRQRWEIGASAGIHDVRVAAAIGGTDSEIGANVSREHLSFKVFDFRR